MSFENNSFLKLQNFCAEIISKESEKIFNSIDFVSISVKCLISLIKHNNIQMNDIIKFGKMYSNGVLFKVLNFLLIFQVIQKMILIL